MDLETVRRTAASSGLTLRGGFHPDAEDRVPPMKDGRPVRTLLLLGNVGDAMWQAFQASPEGAAAGVGAEVSESPEERGGGVRSPGRPEASPAPEPLDRWSRRIIVALSKQLEAEALFPFGGPPYYPFPSWARKSEPVWPSPLGMLVHRDHGLWHAYRGALCFDRHIEFAPVDPETSPCLTCAGQPCLSACPVSAFSEQGYDVPVCAAHIAQPAGADCMAQGCRARRACPLGSAARYRPEQAAFHMRAFLAARPG